MIKVTPSSKVVGDLSQFMVQNKITDEKTLLAKVDELSFPNSVIDFFQVRHDASLKGQALVLSFLLYALFVFSCCLSFSFCFVFCLLACSSSFCPSHQGGIGQPYGGFVEPLRSKVLKGAKVYEARPGAAIPPVDFERLKAELKEKFPQEKIRDVDVMSAALYPQVFNEYMEFKQKYGPVHLLPTPNYFVPTPMGEEVAVTLRPGLLLFLLLLLRSFPLLCFSLLCSFSSFLRLSPLLSFLSFQLAVCCFFVFSFL